MIISIFLAQQLECETENTDQELLRKESPRMINEDGPSQENQKHQLQHTVVIVNNDPEKPSPPHQLYPFQGRNQENLRRGIVQPMQKDLSPEQDSLAKHDNSQMMLPSKAPTFQVSSQKSLLTRPIDSPRPTTINVSNYGRFLSPYSHINKPYTFETSLSPARAPQYQLFNSSSKAPCTSQQSQNWMQQGKNMNKNYFEGAQNYVARTLFQPAHPPLYFMTRPLYT